MTSGNCKICGVACSGRGSVVRVYCSVECKGKAQTAVRPSKEWLHRKYIVERLSANEIAELVNRDSKRVWEWLKWEGIPIRPRGTDYGHGFQAGAPSAFKGKSHTPEYREAMRVRSLKDGRVPYFKDGKPWMKGRHGSLSPVWRGGHTPERNAFYATDEWKGAVRRVWHREDARCKRCALDSRIALKAGSNFHIHHIVGFANRALRAKVSNLVLLCGPCHRFVHSKANIGREYLR